jgi:hypothetical protein
MVAGRLVARQPDRLYDREAERQEQQAVVGPGGYGLPGYRGLLPVVAPPWVALYAAPVAALGLGRGGRLWFAAQVVALAAGLLLVSGWREPARALRAVGGVPHVLLLRNALVTDLAVAGFALLLAGMAAAGPLLLLTVGSLALAIRIPQAAAASGGCLLLGALLTGVAAIAGRPRAIGIIGHEFGSR